MTTAPWLPKYSESAGNIRVSAPVSRSVTGQDFTDARIAADMLGSHAEATPTVLEAELGNLCTGAATSRHSIMSHFVRVGVSGGGWIRLQQGSSSGAHGDLGGFY
jgi:hypothetical protein